MATPVQRFYRLQARFYDQTRWAFLYGRRRAVERLGVGADHAVLDVGCGTGQNFRHIVPLLSPAHGLLIGMDFSFDMLARAARRCAAAGWPNVKLVCQDGAGMRLNRMFDRILLCYSLSMIPDWRSALDRVREHVSPGGRLVVHDFGRFDRWGPVAPLVAAWLRWNHVQADRPWVAHVCGLFTRAQVMTGLGGYYVTVVAEA